MGGKSSKQRIEEHIAQTDDHKRVLIASQIKYENERRSYQAKALQAERKGLDSRVFLKHVVATDNVLKSIDTHISRLDGMTRDITSQQVGAVMLENTTSFNKVSQAILKDTQTEDLQKIKDEYVNTQKDLKERKKHIDSMFTDDVENDVNLDDMVNELKEQVALETMQSMPDVTLRVQVKETPMKNIKEKNLTS